MTDASVTLEQKVAALCRPDTYLAPPTRVEVIETHMSFVFLTPAYAYKLKKPVRYDFLDFSTVALRKLSCEEELRLNQRLAPGVYLGVVPLARTAEGRLRLGSEGDAVEWLVQMRRLPEDRMLHEMIRRGTLRQNDLEALAVRLSRFFRACTPEPITASEYEDRLRTEIEADYGALRAHRDRLDPAAIEELNVLQRRCVDSQGVLFERRVAEGRIVEGHGDLRPEHVCLLEEPVVFDCLEFNRKLRIVDALDELAYLAMESERLGAGDAGASVIAGCALRTADTAPPRLVDFYKSRRAALRSRLCILHLRELGQTAARRWVVQANQYLRVALDYAHRIA